MTIILHYIIAISKSEMWIQGGVMAIIRKEQKEKSKNVLLRVSIPASLMVEIKKIKKMCKDNDFYFDIKPDVIKAVERAVEEAKALMQKEKNSR